MPRRTSNNAVKSSSSTTVKRRINKRESRRVSNRNFIRSNARPALISESQGEAVGLQSSYDEGTTSNRRRSARLRARQLTHLADFVENARSHSSLIINVVPGNGTANQNEIPVYSEAPDSPNNTVTSSHSSHIGRPDSPGIDDVIAVRISSQQQPNISVVDLTTEDTLDVVSVTSSSSINSLPILVFDQEVERAASLETLIDSTEPRSNNQNCGDTQILHIDNPGRRETNVGSDSHIVRCPICMRDKYDIESNCDHLVSTTCGHVFCQSCITDSMKHRSVCPTCRAKLTKKRIHPLFI